MRVVAPGERAYQQITGRSECPSHCSRRVEPSASQRVGRKSTFSREVADRSRQALAPVGRARVRTRDNSGGRTQLLDEPVVAELFAVIRRDHDQRVVPLASLLEGLDDATQWKSTSLIMP